MPFDPIVWSDGDVITSDRLNKMVENDLFLKNRKVRGALRNMDRSGNESTNMRYIKENLIVIGGYNEFRPGSDFPNPKAEGVKKVAPVFEKTFNFPKSGFSPVFLPVVVATVGTKRGLKRISYTLKRVTTGSFTIAIREFDKDLYFTKDMDYFICWIAMGVQQ